MTPRSLTVRLNRSVVWLAWAVPGAAAYAADRKPNVVLFMADDFGWMAFGPTVVNTTRRTSTDSRPPVAVVFFTR